MKPEINSPFFSIVMPVYNRARFLEIAITKIKLQSNNDWELIIVDDGSTDQSLSLAKSLTSDIFTKTIVLTQDNAGPGAARQKGVNAANGKYIAFYDSDDEWLPEHLEVCQKHLISNTNIDWIYTALQRFNIHHNEVVEANSFYNNDKPKEFYRLKTTSIDGVNILKDSRTALYSIKYGIEACFQCSVIKKALFNNLSISKHRIGEDRLFITKAIKHGYVLAYVERITVKYNIHDNNISDTNKNADIDSRVVKNLHLIESYIDTLREIRNLSVKEKFTLKSKIANELFWGIGYSIYWNNGLRPNAFEYFIKGITYNKFNFLFYKTLIVCLIKHYLNSR